MRIYERKESCCGCGACAEICPQGAIHMVPDMEGFLYSKVRKSVCTGCGKCMQVCPLKNVEVISDKNIYMGVQAKDHKVRYSSSSGGFFPTLAQHVIEKEGFVYGAGFGSDMEVIHQEAVDLNQLEQIKRTKYVQSSMRGIYKKVERSLKDNKWVLFSGTPCQVRALNLFLNKSYERLITVDLICYGVPSPGIWKAYVGYLERRHKGKLTNFLFRDKRNGDNGHMRSYVINGKEYTDLLSRDIFCKMFFRNYIIRPSCYSCHFCTVNRGSDFTIGDFWGIENVYPDIDDGFGTSVIIAHSDQAKKIWDEVKKELFWFECKEEDILQPRLLKPVSPAKRRGWFWLLFHIMPFWVTAKRMER